MNKTPTLSAEEFRRMAGLAVDKPAATSGAITIYGRPVPKGRPRLGKGGHVYTPQATRLYEFAVATLAREAFAQPLEGDVMMRLRFYIHGRKRPDIDNAIKAVADGMNGIAYKDDRQVVKVDAAFVPCEKADERAEVFVSEWTEERGAEK